MSEILTSDDLGEVIRVLRNEVVNQWVKVGFALNLKFCDLEPLRQNFDTQELGTADRYVGFVAKPSIQHRKVWITDLGVFS